MGQEFPISGSIDPASFPFLLANLHQQGATGSLKVDGATYQKALYFRSGRILFGSSNDPRDQLGAILIESGRLDGAQLDAASAKVGPGNPLAKVLSDGGLVTQRELSEAAKLKVERILCDLLSIDEGSFEFEDDVLPKGAIDLKLPTQRLFVAALRRVDDRAFVRRHVGGPETVLGLTPQAGERLADVFADVGGLPDVLDGRRPLREAAQMARLDPDEAAKLACALVFLGLARKVASDAFQAIESEDDELDFAPTARINLDSLTASTQSDDVAPPAFEADAGDTPFFLSNEPAAPVPVQAAPVFAIDPAVFAPPPPTEPEPEPEVQETLVLPRPAEAVQPPPAPAAPVRASEPEPTIVQRPAPAASPRPDRAGLPLVPPPPRRQPPKPPAEESEPTLAAPPAARPSREDLEALDSLLNSRSIETPLSSATAGGASPASGVRRAPAWEPSFGRGTPARGRRQTGAGARIGVVVAALVALALASVAAWYFLLRPRPTPQAALPQPTRPRASVVTLAPSATPVTSETPSTVAAATPTPTLATPSPVVAPATPAAQPVVTRNADAGSLDEARARLRAGDLGPAARAFAASVRAAPRNTFSIQLLLACSPETIGKAVAQAGAPELYIVPIRYRGRDCHRVCWGLYDGRARAESALRSVPPYFREGGAAPKVLSTSELLR